MGGHFVFTSVDFIFVYAKCLSGTKLWGIFEYWETLNKFIQPFLKYSAHIKGIVGQLGIFQ